MALDGLIDRFTASLPPLERSGSPDAALTSLVTHTMARAATIQLRSNFRDHDRMNDRKDFAAAQQAAALLDSFNVATTNVDPILAVRLPCPCLITFQCPMLTLAGCLDPVDGGKPRAHR